MMDKKTTIGLVLIGLLLTVFTLINQPSKEDIAKAKKEQAAKEKSQAKEDAASKKNKKDSNPSYKLSCYTRTAIYTCLKERNISKYKNTFDLLPYTLEELIIHLESKFKDGMTWTNYGEWHVDHIKPMSSFNIINSTDSEFLVCWSLDNLQPLWGGDNLSKGSRF